MQIYTQDLSVQQFFHCDFGNLQVGGVGAGLQQQQQQQSQVYGQQQSQAYGQQQPQAYGQQQQQSYGGQGQTMSGAAGRVPTQGMSYQQADYGRSVLGHVLTLVR